MLVGGGGEGEGVSLCVWKTHRMTQLFDQTDEKSNFSTLNQGIMKSIIP